MTIANIDTQVNPYKLDDTLKSLMMYAKGCDAVTIEGTIDVLRPIYSDCIQLLDVFHVVSSAWTRALDEPRFGMRSAPDAWTSIMFAPIKGFHAVELWGPKSPNTVYSVEQFYTSMLKAMMSDLRFTRVDWLNFTDTSEQA